MPKEEKEIDLEELKVDPKMWMRLATPLDNSGNLGSVFTEKENPFEKNGVAAMNKVRELASEGKLYFRDKGRSRHFHEVKLDGDALKLGDQREIKLSNDKADLPLSLLMRLSRRYFKSIGLDRISNWFDKRLKHRAAVLELESQHKKEYKSMRDVEKKQLKALRKHEKNLKKLEKIQKKAEETQRKLDELRGIDSTKNKGEIDSPLSQPPVIEQEKVPMQPIPLGDQPPQVKKQEETKRDEKLIQERATEGEIPGEKKEKTEQKEKTDQDVLKGVEYTEENFRDLPKDIKAALQVIQEFLAQQKAIEEAIRQRNQEQQNITKENEQQTEPLVGENTPNVNETQQTEEPLIEEEQQQAQETQTTAEPLIEDEQQQTQETQDPESTEQKNGVLIDLDAFQQAGDDKENADREVDLTELQQIFSGNAEQPGNHVEEMQTEGPIQEPQAVVDTGNVDVQETQTVEKTETVVVQPNERKKTPLQERLVAEKEEIESANTWKDRTANTLFSHDESKDLMDYYQTIKTEQTDVEFLVGAVAGILTNDQASAEQKQQVLDALVNGKPLGSEHDNLINDGIVAYQNAKQESEAGDSQPLAKMLADSMRTLSWRAGQETTLSAGAVMIGRLLSNTAKIATENTLELPLTEDELNLARGAAIMAEVALRYHDARQYLGNQPMDLESQQGKDAVRDLLMGNAMEKMIQQDKRLGQTITNTQQIMGKGMWSMDNLQAFTEETVALRTIQPKEIQTLLENPNSTKALSIGKSTFNEIAYASMELQEEFNRSKQQEPEMAQKKDLPEIDAPKIPG